MARLLEHFIDQADWNSGTFPERYSVIIRSDLLERPIQIPYATWEQNTIPVIMREFEKVEQSNKRKGMQSMFEAPLNVSF